MDDPGDFFDLAADLDPWLTGRGVETNDVAFYRDLARESDGPALELGVGAGRVYLELLAEGLDVDGVDLSEEALANLREAAADRGLKPRCGAAT